MSSHTSRALSTSSKKALKWVGGTKADIIAHNPGKNGAKVVEAIEAVEAKAEEKYGAKASYVQIQGTKLHKSTKDPTEMKEVVTISIHTEKGTRLESGHVRENGTSTRHETRSGEGKN